MNTSLVLRPIGAEDADHLFRLDNDPEVMRWINGGEQIDRARFDQKVLPVYLQQDDSPFGFYIIELNGAFAGWVSLRSSDADSAVLGYRIVRDCWGKGLASSAASTMLDRVWRETSIQQVTATTYEENAGSQRVLEKLGFRLARRFRLTADQLDANDTSVSDGTLWPGEDLEFVIERG